MLLSFDDTIFADSAIYWKPYYGGGKLCSRFSIDEWNKIAGGIATDDEAWDDYIHEYKDIINCYTLHKQSDHQMIGFICLYLESYSRRIIAVHGGVWSKSLGMSVYAYHGLMVVIEQLLKQGIRVRTACLVNNEHAYNFLRSVGFVKYTTEDGSHKMWITAERLYKSKIYGHLYKRTKNT